MSTTFQLQRAVEVIERVRAKLQGADFNETATEISGITNESDNTNTLDVPSQVKRLIEEATSHENLCQTYLGWSPCW
jgi:FKBP12-rapamycin complex-associated protein